MAAAIQMEWDGLSDSIRPGPGPYYWRGNALLLTAPPMARMPVAL